MGDNANGWAWIQDVLWTVQWRNNGRYGVSNHQPRDCLLSRLFRRRSRKTAKFRVTGLCAGNPPVTGEFPVQMASNAEMFPVDDVIMKIVNTKYMHVSVPLIMQHDMSVANILQT